MKQELVSWLNQLTADQAREEFRRCCGATCWCDRMVAARPFASADAVKKSADQAFEQMPEEDWLKAFACHPRIGDLNSLRMKFTGNKEWSGGEQAGAAAADDATLQSLADANEIYFERFGYLFIVCATGKSAAEMLAILESRLGNDPEMELIAAAAEQRKITHLRLGKMEAV